MKVLIVDDDKNVNEFLSRVMKTRLNCRIESAMNGIDAISYLNTELVDLILLDVAMPIVSGVEVLEIVRNDKRLKHIPVVMITANKEKEIATRLVELGIMGYILKPLMIDNLVKNMRDIFEKISKMEKPAVVEEAGDSKMSLLLAVENPDLRAQIKNKVTGFEEIHETANGVEVLKIFMKEKPLVVFASAGIQILSDILLAKSLKKVAGTRKFKMIISRESGKITAEENQFIHGVVEISNNKTELAEKIAEKINESIK
ncbi:MAG: response regulator [Melioribacteraceae bacterium]|nr:response regulator [Melioribacteraceae bacterium]